MCLLHFIMQSRKPKTEGMILWIVKKQRCCFPSWSPLAQFPLVHRNRLKRKARSKAPLLCCRWIKKSSPKTTWQLYTTPSPWKSDTKKSSPRKAQSHCLSGRYQTSSETSEAPSYLSFLRRALCLSLAWHQVVLHLRRFARHKISGAIRHFSGSRGSLFMKELQLQCYLCISIPTPWDLKTHRKTIKPINKKFWLNFFKSLRGAGALPLPGM